MEKFLYYNNLYLIYKELLNAKMQEIFDLYYGQNLTMQEIAELKNISKSRVGMIIKNVEHKLDHFEEILKVYASNVKLAKVLELDNIKEIKDTIEDILKGE